MSKITLTNLVNLQNEITAVNAINTNNAVLTTALNNTLSRDGTSPNTMGSNLDMNSNQILNLPAPAVGTAPLRLQDLSSFVGGGTVTNIPAGGTTGQVLNKTSNTDYATGWTNSVTSVGLALPADLTVTNSPVTTTGTLTGAWAVTPTGTGAMVRATSPTLVTPALGTPASGVMTNVTGTAANLTAGHVTTNANLTGPITSVGNATSVAAQTGTGSTFVMNTAPTISNPTVSTGTFTSPALVTPALGTPASGIMTNVTGTASGLTAGTVTTNANLTGDVTSVGNATTLTNAPVIAKVLTGYVSGAGTVASTDSILAAIQKLNGNDATNANLTGPITSVGNATTVAAQTGTGSTFVMNTSPTITSPTLVTPVLGTPTSGVATNLTGTASGLTAGTVTTNANLTGPITSVGNATSVASQTGTGSTFVMNTSPTLVTPILGTPTSGTLTNATGLPISTGVSGLATGIATFLATPSSANLAAAVTDETGTAGLVVFSASPTFTGTPQAPTATANTNSPQLATTAFVLAQSSAATPLMDGTAAVGTTTKFSREDHIHPTDTTRLAVAGNQTVTGGFNVTANNLGTPASFTCAPLSGNYQYFINGSAVTITAPASDCAIDYLMTNNATAGAVTFSGFTVSTTGDPLTTTNTAKFIISIRRINSISTYIIKALQ